MKKKGNQEILTLTEAKDVCTRMVKEVYFPSASISVEYVGIETVINFFKL
jgi:hypothetical protein